MAGLEVQLPIHGRGRIKSGTREGSRTLNILFLKQTSLPIGLPEHGASDGI
jgi:hypothetical protein